MTFADAKAALEGYLHAQWSATPVVWQNVEDIDFGTTGQPLLSEGQNPFIAVEIFIHTSQTITVPGNCIRYPGSIEFAVYVKEGQGSRQQAALTDQLIALFENTDIGSHPNKIRVRNITTTNTYINESGWYVQLIGFAIYFERFISNP